MTDPTHFCKVFIHLQRIIWIFEQSTRLTTLFSFCKGSNIANEADNVVQMFLMSMNNRQNFSPPDQPDDHANNKTILAQMRKDFFTNTQQSPEKREQTKVTNKYLKPENLYVPSSKPNAEDQVVQSFIQPSFSLKTANLSSTLLPKSVQNCI